MENICLINNNIAVCRADMSNLSIGKPNLSNHEVENALFELVSIKRWRNMIRFIDKWAPYGLPWYSSGGVLWEEPILKKSGKRQIAGDVARERKALELGNADDLQPVIDRYQENMDLARDIELSGSRSRLFNVIDDEFDMRLKAIDDRIDQSSIVIGIEELLAQRAMLLLACKLYRGFLIADFSDELFAKTDLRVRKDKQIQVSFNCEELYENTWVHDRYYEKRLGDMPTTFMMGNMPAWEAYSLEADLSTDHARKGFFVICPESIDQSVDAIRYASGVFAAALINENALHSKDEDGRGYMNRDLREVSDAGLIWQLWNHLGNIFDARAPIGECANCRIPIPIAGRLEYCSDACKTAASKKRRELAMRYAADGKPLEEAVKAVGERYRSNVERWYVDAGRFGEVSKKGK